MPARTALVAALLAAAVGCSSGSPAADNRDAHSRGAHSGGSSQGGSAAGPGTACGQFSTATYRHVVWIWMENRTYESVLGANGDAPRLRQYADACGLATDYSAITNPSLPNYIAAVAGHRYGIDRDCSPAVCSLAEKSLFQQVTHAGRHWRAFAESMDRRCDRRSYGRYAARHNPAVYFTPIRDQCRHRDVRMGGVDGPFARALADDRLPAFTFVTPNLCHDGHDCSTAVADDWLGRHLDRITASPAYADGDAVLFVTWDEGVPGDNHIATVVIGPSVPSGLRVADPFDHYSSLRTTEDLLGLPLLGRARTATSMRSAFGL